MAFTYTMEDLLLPLLHVYTNNNEEELTRQDILKKLAISINLSDEEQYEKLPNGTRTIFRTRAIWAIFELRQAGLLERPRTGYYKRTKDGRQDAESNIPITRKYLLKYDSYVNFLNRKSTTTKEDGINKKQQEDKYITPEERIENAFRDINEKLGEELLGKLREVDPIHFENIIITLMEAMRYGVGLTTPKSHDGGIDGIINEDELGLDKIYLQAKRYCDSNKVNEKEIRDFMGALSINGVTKGVFITTSRFSESVKRTVAINNNIKVILIDGCELVRLMIKHNIGVRTTNTYSLKEIDTGFLQSDDD